MWPAIFREVKQFVAKCPTCIVHLKRTQKAPMGEMPLPKAPMQMVAADLIGPLVRTPQGNSYILTIIDHTMAWAQAYPIPNKTAKEVWNILSKEFLPRHSYPDVFLMDLGLEFSANALRDYLKGLGIDHRRTSSYSPQANGKCEHLNGTLKRMLAKLINNNRDNWEDQLGPALLAYNNSMSNATGHTPFFLLYGRRARLPINCFLGEDSLLEPCLQLVADALRQASDATAEACKYNRARLLARANTVLVKSPEPLSMTSTWDTQWTVTNINRKVVSIVHQQTGKQKRLNINKLCLVNLNIVWDEIRPHPTRKPGRPSMTTGLQADLQHTLPVPEPPILPIARTPDPPIQQTPAPGNKHPMHGLPGTTHLQNNENAGGHKHKRPVEASQQQCDPIRPIKAPNVSARNALQLPDNASRQNASQLQPTAYACSSIDQHGHKRAPFTAWKSFCSQTEPYTIYSQQNIATQKGIT